MSNRNNKPPTALDVASEPFVNRQKQRGFNNNPTNQRVILQKHILEKQISELAMNRFKWTNLPEEISVRYLERTMYFNALSVFYHDGRYDKFMALRGASAGFPNYQDEPTSFNVVGSNFISRTVSAVRDKTDENGVVMGKAIPIWANYNRIPDFHIVQLYADRIAEIDRTIDINAKNARQPKVAAFTQDAALSVVNINRQIDEGQGFIQVNGKSINDINEVFQVLDLAIDVKDIEVLHILRTRLWNECMGLLGIDNANQDKKERLVASEVDANNQQSSLSRFVNLNARREAAELINDHYGLKIEVEYHTIAEEQELMENAQEIAQKNMEGNNGNVHNEAD